MGQLALTIGGNLVGGFLGAAVGLPQVGAAIGSLVGGVAGMLLFQPKTDYPHIGSAAIGSPIPLGYGTVKLPGHLIWSAPYQKSGGLFGKGSLLGGLQEEFSITFAVAFARGGPGTQLWALWADNYGLFDATTGGELSPVQGSGVNGVPIVYTGTIKDGVTFTFYSGDEEQLPDPTISAWVQQNGGTVVDPTNQLPDGTFYLVNDGFPYPMTTYPAHRGLCYIVFENLLLKNFGNRLPQITALISFNSAPAQPYVGYMPIASPATSIPGNSGQLAVDWTRLTYYTADTFAPQLSKVDVPTMALLASPAMTSVFANGENWGAYALGTGSSGDIYIGSWAASNSSPLVKVDPNSLKEVARIGGVGNSLTLSATNLPVVATIGCFAMNEGGADIVMAMTLFGGLAAINSITWKVCWFDGMNGDPTLMPGSAQMLGVHDIGEGTALMMVHQTSRAVYSAEPIHVFELWGNNGAEIDPNTGKTIGFAIVQVATIGFADIAALAGVAGATAYVAGFTSGSAYDASDGGLLVSATLQTSGGFVSVICKWRQDIGLMWATIGPGLSGGGGQYARFTGGKFAWFAGTHSLYQIDATNGVLTGPTNWPVLTIGGQQVFDSSADAILLSGVSAATQGDGRNTNQVAVFLNRVTGGDSTLDQVVLDLVAQAGLQSSDIDVSRLTNDDVAGYVVGRPDTMREALAPLMQAYFFDMVESDDIIKCVPRGQPVVRDLQQRQLAAPTDRSSEEFFTEQRLQDFDLPVAVNIRFTDFNNLYLPGSEMVRRTAQPKPAMYSTNRLDLTLPLMLSSDWAAQIGERMLYSTWAERSNYGFTLDWGNADLDPTDVVQVTMLDGTVVFPRLTRMEFGADYSIQCAGVEQYQSTTYTSTRQGGRPRIGRTTVPLGGLRTWFTLLDTPLLRDQDDLGGSASRVYLVGSGYSASLGWSGATVYYSVDGMTYTAVATLGRAAAWGSCINALPPNPDPFSWDTATRLIVAMASGAESLQSVTDTQVLTAWANAFAVKDTNGNWEVIQAAGVVQNADGTFTLSRILRGRRGTDAFTDAHAAGDAIIYLPADGSVVPAVIGLGDIGAARYWKAVTAGQSLSATPALIVSASGNDLKPYAPVHVGATINASNDIVLSWTRRTRIGGNLHDGTGAVPLAEVSESYSIDIMSGPGGTVKRNLISTSPTAIYANADVLADFGAVPPTLTVHVFQVSAAIGRGFTREATVQVA